MKPNVYTQLQSIAIAHCLPPCNIQGWEWSGYVPWLLGGGSAWLARCNDHDLFPPSNLHITTFSPSVSLYFSLSISPSFSLSTNKTPKHRWFPGESQTKLSNQQIMYLACLGAGSIHIYISKSLPLSLSLSLPLSLSLFSLICIHIRYPQLWSYFQDLFSRYFLVEKPQDAACTFKDKTLKVDYMVMIVITRIIFKIVSQ